MLQASAGLRTPDYYAELLSTAENLTVFASPNTAPETKRLALVKILAMFETNHPDKLKAALDMKLPYHLMKYIRASETRYESLQILYYISKGCCAGVSPAEGSGSMRNALTVATYLAASVPSEERPDYAKTSAAHTTLDPSIIELSHCFTNPLLINILNFYAKLRTEPYANRECIAYIFSNLLKGREELVSVLLSPATNVVATITKGLVLNNFNVDRLSSRMITTITTKTFRRLIRARNPRLLKSLAMLPGGKALMRD
jgi:hypothetical protein